MEETLELALDLNCEFVNFYSAMAYPGSALYTWASKKEGYLPENWEAFSQHGYETRPLPTRYLPAREVLRFRDEAFSRYFKNPRYLDLMEKKFGSRVRAHLAKMVEIKLTRRLTREPGERVIPKG
jgi:hypothetical protein